LFGTFGRKKASALTVPWCTYTTPEVAHVGLSEHDATARGIEVTTLTVPLREVDRAVLDGEDDGFLRVHLKKGSDRVVGATLVATHAGDMISELTLAMTAGIGLGAIAATIHPYPTQAEAMKKAADAYNRTRLTPTVKALFRWWLGRSRWERWASPRATARSASSSTTRRASARPPTSAWGCWRSACAAPIARSAASSSAHRPRAPSTSSSDTSVSRRCSRPARRGRTRPRGVR